ncbi:MAG: family transcriptional regulator, cyclic receptor protein [Pseudomonadota bacterium]|nr:family transcriptional regulator, cyclic receptor protein [Pseudomonadota bacterium]
MQERAFARREIVASQGETSSFLGFLLEGRLQGVDFTVDGREVGLYFVEPGGYYGELAIIDGKPGAEFVIALAKSRVALLPREHARKLIFANPHIAEVLLLNLAERVRSGTAQRTILSLPNVFQRLCAQLLLLGGNASLIPHAPTHQELAIMINTSRETVTRSFQLLQSQNILQRDGNSLKIIDKRYLDGILNGDIPPPKT